MTLRVDKYVQPGGEGYLKWAGRRLQILRDQREDLRLPAMSKAWQVTPDVRVHLKTTEFGDKIWIFAGDPNHGFISNPYMRKLSPSTEKEFINSREDAFLPFAKQVWEALGVNGTFTIGKPFNKGSDTYTPAGAIHLLNRESQTFGTSGASYNRVGVFPHTYTVEGVAQTELLQLGHNGVLYKRVNNVRTALTSSGDAIFATIVSFTADETGRTLIAQRSDGVAWRGTIDLALSTPVTWALITETTPYGSETLTSIRTGGLTSNNINDTQIGEATWILSRGVKADGTEALIDLVYTRLDSFISNNAVSLDGGTGPGFSGAASSEQIELDTYTIRMPGGLTKTFRLIDKELITSGSQSAPYTGTHHVVTAESYTASLTQTSQDLNILYLDPTVPILVYECITTSTVTTGTTPQFPGSPFSVNALMDLETTTTRVVGVLTDTADIILSTEVTAPVASGPIATSCFNYNSSINGSNSTTVTTSDISDQDVGPLPSRHSFTPSNGTTSVAAKSLENWLVSDTRPFTLDGAATPSFKLFRGAANNGFENITASFLTYVSESLPDTGGPDQEAIDSAQVNIDQLNALLADPATIAALIPFFGSEAAVIAAVNELITQQQAIIDAELAKPPGEPDPDAALVLTNPELFEIRAENLTYT